ncbi:MAG: lycopene cyclase domain-containing protein [Chloroflexota bacterium]
MTYPRFLAVFVAPPIVLLLMLLLGRRARIPWLAIAALSLVALAYTSPWDNALILNGVWSYPRGRVVGVTIGVVPVEEYAFFVLQTILTSLLAVAVLRRHIKRSQRPDRSSQPA